MRRVKRRQKELYAYVKDLLVDDFFAWAKEAGREVAPNSPQGAAEIYSLAEQLIAEYYAERTG